MKMTEPHLTAAMKHTYVLITYLLTYLIIYVLNYLVTYSMEQSPS
jgi:hypothetical protein